MEWLAIQKEVVALELVIQTIPTSTTSLLPYCLLLYFIIFLSSSIFCLYPIYCYNLCSQFNTCVPHLGRFLYISLHLSASLPLYLFTFDLSISLPLFNTLISFFYSPPPPSSNLKPQTTTQFLHFLHSQCRTKWTTPIPHWQAEPAATIRWSPPKSEV